MSSCSRRNGPRAAPATGQSWSGRPVDNAGPAFEERAHSAGMTLKRPEETFVRTTTELTQLWSDLMGDGGFSCRSVWMVFLAPSGELRAPVVPIDDLPPLPDKLCWATSL